MVTRRAAARSLRILALAFTVHSLLPWLGRYYYLFDLTSHFRVQYAVIALTLLVLGALVRDRIVSLAMGLVLLTHLAVIAPCWIERDYPPRAPGVRQVYRLLSFNTLFSNATPDALRHFLIAENPDVAIFFEWNARLEASFLQKPPLPGLSRVVSRPEESPLGIAIYARHPVRRAELLFPGGEAIPGALAQLELGGKTLSLVAAHPMPAMGPRTFRQRQTYLEETSKLLATLGGARILAGDLNLTPWSPWWDSLLEAGQLIDSRKGFGVHATWPANLWALMIPIDHVLVSQEVRVRRRRLGPALGSDHRPVVVDFEL